MKKLEAVNMMLASISQARVTSTESNNPYVVDAVATLDTVSLDIQETGWYFNTVYDKELHPTKEGYIILPYQCLRIQDNYTKMSFVQRNEMLYNPIDNKERFDSPVTVDIVVFIEFEHLPRVAATCIARKATLDFFSNRDGDPNQIRILAANFTDAVNNLHTESLQQLGVSSMDSPHVHQFLGRQHRSRGIISPVQHTLRGGVWRPK